MSPDWKAVSYRETEVREDVAAYKLVIARGQQERTFDGEVSTAQGGDEEERQEHVFQSALVVLGNEEAG